VVSGGLGNDTLVGEAGDDLLVANAGNDVLMADAGDDILYGGTGNDTLYGGEGSDTFVFNISTRALGLDGNDTIADFSIEQNDRVFLSSELPLPLNLAAYAVTHAGADTVLTFYNGKTITLAGVNLSPELLTTAVSMTGHSPIQSGPYSQSMSNIDDNFVDTGSFKVDIPARPADDQDTLTGGSGGSGEHNLMFGLGGDDTITGGDSGNDLTGGSGNDIIVDGVRDGYVHGNSGNDTLSGGGGDDYGIGGSGDDQMSGGTGNDELFGGSGNDVLNGDDGDDHLRGGLGDDQLNGGNGNDTLAGGAGADTLLGGAGDDVLSATEYEPRPDELFGNQHPVDFAGASFGRPSLIDAGDGNDILWGGTGSDTLNGGTGNDALYGLAGNDLLVGGTGQDFLDGGSGVDQLTGGTGDDTFIYRSGQGSTNPLAAEVLTDFQGAGGAGGDVLWLDVSEPALGSFDHVSGSLYAFADGATGLIEYINVVSNNGALLGAADYVFI
jgi:Ca2+-binding RTX toxin-like protein